MNIKFGTDGWRAVIAEDFTFGNVAKVSQAIADYVKNRLPMAGHREQSAIAIGYDMRFMGKEFAQAAADVIYGNGIKVYLSNGPTSTPALSLYIRQNKLTGGIMVTASHNPPRYNGIKYKAE